MKWSWKLGRIAGINVQIHATFVLLIAWIVLVQWNAAHSFRAVLYGISLILALFACIVLHEFGHALTAKHFGIATRDINLLPIGGVSRMERMPESPWQEFWIAVAGPLVSLGIAGALYIFVRVARLPSSLNGVTEIAAWKNISGLVAEVMFANLVLALFNLLPAFPMDGGRIFRSALAGRMEHARATQIAANVGQALALIFGLIGLFGNPFLLLIALFIWVGGTQEAAVAELKSAFAGIPISQLAVTSFVPVSSSDSLANVARLMLHGTQQDFPVTDNGHVGGLLTRKDLLKGLSTTGPDGLVKDAMRRDYRVVSASDSLQSTFDKFSDGSPLLVMRGEELVGLFTLENLAEFVMVQAALEAQPGRTKLNVEAHDVFTNLLRHRSPISSKIA